MKKVKSYSAQYKIISEQPNQNQNHPNEYAKNTKNLSKQNQELINKTSASGFTQFHKIQTIS